MARNDDRDDLLQGPVPAPDAEPTSSERAHARTFAELVDKTIAGRMPAAMTADDRALLEVATVIRATADGPESDDAGRWRAGARAGVDLTPSRQRALVEDALRQAIGGPGVSRGTTLPVPVSRAKRWAPWMVATTSTLVAVAAIAMLWFRVPTKRATTPTAAATPAQIPATWKSRPSDAQIGPIAREHDGDASARLDFIFADRLDGYRERRLARGGLP